MQTTKYQTNQLAWSEKWRDGRYRVAIRDHYNQNGGHYVDRTYSTWEHAKFDTALAIALIDGGATADNAASQLLSQED